MKYLCLVLLDEKKLEALSQSEAAALDKDSLAYDQTLRKNGHFLAAEALQPIRTAKTVRVREGRALVTDGPFVETKEQVGGFILIEARDMNEAIQVAGKIPVARFGGVEIRPIMQIGEQQG
jgi:hypothetical protein